MEEPPRRATLGELMRMVLSAFIGVRRHAELDRVRVRPLQVIIIGVLAAALFVLGLVSVVRLVTR